MTNARSCNKKGSFLARSCKIPKRILQDLKRFPVRISLAIKKDLFWHNIAGSYRITLSGQVGIRTYHI